MDVQLSFASIGGCWVVTWPYAMNKSTSYVVLLTYVVDVIPRVFSSGQTYQQYWQWWVYCNTLFFFKILVIHVTWRRCLLFFGGLLTCIIYKRWNSEQWLLRYVHSTVQRRSSQSHFYRGHGPLEVHSGISPQSRIPWTFCNTQSGKSTFDAREFFFVVFFLAVTVFFLAIPPTLSIAPLLIMRHKSLPAAHWAVLGLRLLSFAAASAAAPQQNITVPRKNAIVIETTSPNMNSRFPQPPLLPRACVQIYCFSYPRVDPLFFVRLLPTPETTGPARLIVKLKKN